MNVAEKSEKFKREHSRAQVVPSEISGMLTLVHDHRTEQIPFLVWDVSPNGIGLLAMDSIDAGKEVTLTVGQPYVMILKCRVSWCVDHGKDGYRCGLQVIKSESKLDALYKEFCKIRKNPSVP